MINLSGKATLYFGTEEFSEEELLDNLDDTNVRSITINTEDGRKIELSSIQFILNELENIDSESEE